MEEFFDITNDFKKILKEKSLCLKIPTTTVFSKKKEVVDFLEMLIESTNVKNIFYKKGDKTRQSGLNKGEYTLAFNSFLFSVYVPKFEELQYMYHFILFYKVFYLNEDKGKKIVINKEYMYKPTSYDVLENAEREYKNVFGEKREIIFK